MSVPPTPSDYSPLVHTSRGEAQYIYFLETEVQYIYVGVAAPSCK